MKPWKTGGEYILLCGQVPNDKSLRGKNLSGWYQEATNVASKKYGLPVVWRPHPLDNTGAKIRIPNTRLDVGTPLIQSLDKAAAIMAYNSNSLIDGIMNGVPAIAFDEGTMAWELCSKNYEPLMKPDRSEWGRKMGYTQWTNEELANGSAVSHIFKRYLK
jgi:hypothetical protein